MTEKDKTRIAMSGLADLLLRDAAETAADPRYTRPDGAPIPLVGELIRHAKELKRRAKRK